MSRGRQRLRELTHHAQGAVEGLDTWHNPRQAYLYFSRVVLATVEALDELEAMVNAKIETIRLTTEPRRISPDFDIIPTSTATRDDATTSNTTAGKD